MWNWIIKHGVEIIIGVNAIILLLLIWEIIKTWIIKKK